MKRYICSLLLLFFLSCNNNKPEPEVKRDGIIEKWSGLHEKFANVNALYMAYIAPDGSVYEYKKGTNVSGEPVNQNTIFEGASISKTLFAFLYWHLLLNRVIHVDSVNVQGCGGGESIHFSPFEFLSHTAHLTKDTCASDTLERGVFSYAEQGYLALQKHIEHQTGKNLEQLARQYIFSRYNMNESSFLWKTSYGNYVNGYVKDNEYHRDIHKFNRPAANGSLYTSGIELVNFTRMLMQSHEMDSMSVFYTKVPRFNNLYWGRGIGIELADEKKYCWQWGSNWSFRSFYLVNTTDRSALICLTNSIYGAGDIKEAFNWLLGREMQAFSYLESL